ncbi:hypothetical protein [Sediminibacterium ginsengisoli]|uniref:YXWGXW repeat-containing protein n=1 Tax=Sediminibacterium ginsengisoli TaxID=413434 RepID=A0A1T4RAK0_9BACT|nr:hypothetical protein [Sediminibacterium ginsengisoli]SKA12949.1 hypothetical protein SAMN04488132_11171 [Sediminibacterium ginsengisoli]
MKKLILPVVLLASVLLSYNDSKAQVRLNVNVNIGRPAWGVPGDYVGDYYYMPEIDTYYYIPERQFIYLDGGRWIFASSLPVAYRNYDLYRGYKVVVNEPRPYLRGNIYRERYNKYYVAYRRPVVIDNRNRYDNRFDDRRFHDNRRDDRHDRWDRDDRRDNDRGRNDHRNNGNGRGPGRGH